MKKVFILILLLPLMAAAQSNYTITGKMPGLKVAAKAYLTIAEGDAYKNKDSADIKNGVFQFKGKVTGTVSAGIIVKRKNAPNTRKDPDAFYFFLDNSNILLTATDSITNTKISGSVVNRDDHELEASLEPFTKKIEKLNRKLNSVNPEFTNANNPAGKITLDEAKKMFDTIQMYVANIRDIRLGFVRLHPSSYISLYTYYWFILDEKFIPGEVEPLFHRLSPQLQSSEMGMQALAKIQAVKERQVGRVAPDFTQNDTTGTPFTLSSLRGKYVLLDFWASWCGPCRAENPNVVKAYHEMKTKNFEVVSVSLDQSKAAWVNAINTDGMPWIHVCDMKGWKNGIAIKYNILSVPQNFLIDPKGVIIATNLRGDDLAEKLSTLIK